VSYKLDLDKGVEEDLGSLAAEQASIPKDWRLSAPEVEQAIDKAILLMASLRDDPRQGELMTGRPNAMLLRNVRRLKFDPRDPPPNDHKGRPRPRMRLVWVNEPDEASVENAFVLAVTHRHRSRPYRRAATRLGARRRRQRPTYE
jgi:hypothetical protein